jgi:hypothetical protein
MMLRLAALALFAITLAAIQSVRVSEAITFSTMDLSCVASCTGDPSQNSGNLGLLSSRQLNGKAAVPAIAMCPDRNAPECASRDSGDHWDKTQQDERYFDAMLSSANKVESEAFDVLIQIRDWELSRDPRSCADLGGQAHSPGEDCSNVEAGSDYTETISVLTVAVIALLALALIPFAWVNAPFLPHLAAAKTCAVEKYDPVVR